MTIEMIENRIIKIIQREIDVNKDVCLTKETVFLEAGIDSILMMMILVYIEEDLKITFDDDVLIVNKFNCIEDFAKYIYTTYSN